MIAATRARRKRRLQALTLVETAITSGISVIVFGVLMFALMSLQRNYAAVEAYGAAEGNQMRISDYLALDVRRALDIAAANDVLTLTVPDYYGNGGAAPAGTAAPVDPVPSGSRVTYGATPLTVKYYQQGNNFNRSVNGVVTVIATDVADFRVTIQDSASTVSCTTTFSPRFTLAPTASAVAATSVFTKVYVRNVSARN